MYGVCEQSTERRMVTVALIDIGVDIGHPEFQNAIWVLDKRRRIGMPVLPSKQPDLPENPFGGFCFMMNAEIPQGLLQGHKKFINIFQKSLDRL